MSQEKPPQIQMAVSQKTQEEENAILQAASNAPDNKQETISESYLANREQDPLLRHGDGSKVHPLTINDSAFLIPQILDAEQIIHEKLQGKPEIRQNNDIEKFSGLKNGKDYLKAISQSFSLQDILTVVDSCHFNYNDEYCPVLLKLGKDYDRHLYAEEEQKTSDVHRYQLQIWKIGGQKIYEREISTDAALEKPIVNWNIFGDVFVFQEKNEFCVVQCYPEKNCELYKFVLPQEIYINDSDDSNLPSRKIGYWNKNMILVQDNKVYNLNIAQFMENYNPEMETENTVNLSMNQLSFTEFDEGYYPVQFTFVDKDTTCLVVADKEQNKATFLQLKVIKKSKIDFKQIGLKFTDILAQLLPPSEKTSSNSRINQFISVMCKDSQDKVFQAGISLLEDGTLHFYNDFEYLNGDKRHIVQIETDLDRFYFRNQPSIDVDLLPSREQTIFSTKYFQVKIEMRRRLGFASAKQCTDSDNLIQTKFQYMLHRRISDYFKIFKTYLNFYTFFIIAYRDRFFVFDLTKQIDLCVLQMKVTGQVVSMAIVKEKLDSHVLLTTQDNELIVIDKHLKRTSYSLFSSQERVLLVQADKYQQKCVFYLTKTISSKKTHAFYVKRGQNVFKNYEDAEQELGDLVVKLYACTASGQPQLTLSSAEGANLNQKSRIVVYSEYGNDGDNKTTVKLMIDTPSVPFVRSSQMYTLKSDKSGFRLEKDEIDLVIEENDTGELIGVVTALNPDRKMKGSIARVTTESITFYDQDLQFKFAFLNSSVVKMLQIDDAYMYCMLKASNKKYMVKRKDKVAVEATGIFPRERVSGFFVFNMQRMIKDNQIELYQLSKAIVGVNTHLDYSASLQRVSFVENFLSIQMQPFTHRNTINFLGMHPKKNYLMWREKNGFFTALQNNGELHTWSMLTGSHLFEKSDPKLAEDLKNFRVYSSCEKDNQYTRYYYNGKNSTVQLLCSKDPVDFTVFNLQGEEEMNVKKIFTKTEVSQWANINSELELATYQFKVLQLQMHQDFVDDTCEAYVYEEQVCELFNFNMPLTVKIKDDEKREMDGLFQLVLSQDTKKLMVIYENNLFTIYNRTDNSKEVSWEPDMKRWLKKFPGLLQANMKANFLFDPTFTYFINCDFDKGCFVIFKTTGEHYLDIPQDLISFNSNEVGMQSVDVAVQKAKNMFFRSESIIEYISSNGLWMMLSIEKGRIQVKCYSQIKNWYDWTAVQDHAIIQPVKQKQTDVFKRIMRQGQYAEIFLERQKYSEKMDLTNNPQRYKKKDSYQRKLLSSIYQVQHQQDYYNPDSYFQAEATFTILDWLILAQVLTNLKVKIKDVDHNQRLQLTQNIFPNRKTTLHIFVNNCFESDESSDMSGLDNQGVVLTLFETAKKGYLSYGDSKPTFAFEIPIIEDVNGRTPFDFALGIQGKHKLSSLFKDNGNSEMNGINDGNEKKNEIRANMAGILFACTKDYQFLHSAHLISEAIIEAFEQKVPGIGDYIEGRLKPHPYLPKLNQKPIKKEVRHKFLSLQAGQQKSVEYGVKIFQVFNGKQEFQDEMFERTGATKLMKVLQLDIPYIHIPFSIPGIRFIKALQSTKEVDMFLLPSVQAIIDQHWNSFQMSFYLWFCLIIPYLVQLSCFIVWSNFALKQEGASQKLQNGLEYTLALFSFWFLLIELLQLINVGKSYFDSWWNIFEFLPLILILVNVFRHQTEGDSVYFDKLFWDVQAVAALTLWLKTLYLLRYTHSMGYLIRSLVDVIRDMTMFLVLLVIFILMYSDVFSSLNKAQPLYQPQYDAFITGDDYYHAIWYSYNLMLGAWEVNQMSPLATAVFVSATILEVIVMLNLLIAIVSATSERVTASSVQYSFQERVKLINDFYNTVRFGSNSNDGDARIDAPYLFKDIVSKICASARATQGVTKGDKTQLMTLVWEEEKTDSVITEEESGDKEFSTDEKVDLITEVKNLRLQLAYFEELSKSQTVPR